MTRTRIIIAAVLAVALVGLAAPALAHDLEVDADPFGCRQVQVTVNAWSGFADDIDGYAGDDARTVTVGVLVDGVEYTTVDLAPPTFTATTALIVPAGVREITVVPVSAWGDGQPADPNSAQTVTVRATCVVATTTTTTTTVPVTTTAAPPSTTSNPTTTTVPEGPPPCAEPVDGTEPCPFDAPNPPMIPQMPDPTPVPGTPTFTG